MDAPILLIAGIAAIALALFGVVRKITRMIVFAVALATIVVALYVARSGGFVDW